MKKYYLTLLCMLSSLLLSAQIVTNQPNIAVVPFIKQGQDYRTIYEQDPNMRIVMTKIREGFNARNFNTKDFVQELITQGQSSEVYGEGTQVDLKSQVAELTGADIYVIAEIQTRFASSGNSVRILLHACDASTGDSFSDKEGFSGELYSNDVGGLATRALARILDDFLEVLQNKFNKMILEGRSISIDFRIADGVDLTFQSEVEATGDLIGDEIVLWIKKNAYHGVFNRKSFTDLYINYDRVNIPIRDEDGANYDPVEFKKKLNQFLRSLGLRAKIDQIGYSFHVIVTGIRE